MELDVDVSQELFSTSVYFVNHYLVLYQIIIQKVPFILLLLFDTLHFKYLRQLCNSIYTVTQ